MNDVIWALTLAALLMTPCVVVLTARLDESGRR